MELDSVEGNNGFPIRGNGKQLIPVVGGSSGEGLPYAPEDWPKIGDKWKWKVGWRSSNSGFWLDRYLYLPVRIQKLLGKKRVFASKPAIETFLRTEFPGADINSFFASFNWKVPCSIDGQRVAKTPSSELSNGTEGCTAGNTICSVQQRARNLSSEEMDCDVCCSEPGFCRYCCCILCCGIIDWAYGGYSFIRCEANVYGKCICGHVAHLECALRCYMAGTVGGDIGLDVEYYCRRCDNRMDLIGHVKKLLETCKSVNSTETIKKMLQLGFSTLHGSQQATAKNLVDYIQRALEKLQRGVNPRELWEVEDNIVPIAGTTGDASDLQNMPLAQNIAGFVNSPLPTKEFGEGNVKDVYITSDYPIESQKFEIEIDQVLHSLRNSQKSEFILAEQKLYSQKTILLSLYRQLEFERSELAKHTSSPDKRGSDALLSNVLSRVDQVRQEVAKLTQMMKISKGFGRTSKKILTEHFDLKVVD